MSHPVYLHPDVEKYLDSLSDTERRRCFGKLKQLAEDPFTPRSGCDIKRMIGKAPFYRLRVGNHRFLYILEGQEVLVEEAFRRGKGY